MSELIGYLSEVEQLNGELTIPKQLGTLGSKTITANGVYDATDDGVDGYDVVTANVPNTYAAGDEGKVVDNGALVSQTSATYTSNNTYDTTLINSVTVNVSGGSTPTLETVTKTYTPTTSQQTEIITPSSGYDGIGEVDVTVNAIPSQYIIPTGAKSISSNGTGIDVKAYEYADVAVPNSYSASDEGKVVNNGALVAQTSDTVTANDTYDTTLINSLTVNVSGGPSGYESGTYIGAGSGNVIREISVSKKWSHFLIVADNTYSQLTSDTTINLYMAYGDEYGYTVVPLKTTDGAFTANQVQNRPASSYDNWRSQLTFTDTKIKWAFMGNGAIATPINGATYRWFAW